LILMMLLDDNDEERMTRKALLDRKIRFIGIG
jgi:hypothetical protein